MTSPLPKTSLLERGNRWWRGLDSRKQELWATFAPLVAVCIFLAATLAAFVYLKVEEQLREQQSLSMETEAALGNLASRLRMHEISLATLSHKLDPTTPSERFPALVREWLEGNPDIASVSWFDGNGAMLATATITQRNRVNIADATSPIPLMQESSPGAMAVRRPNQWYVTILEEEPATPSAQARTTASDAENAPVASLDLFVPYHTFPLPDDGQTQWLGISLVPDALLRAAVPPESSLPTFSASLLDPQGRIIAGHRLGSLHEGMHSELENLSLEWTPPVQMHSPIAALGEQARLFTRIYRTDSVLTERAFLGLLVSMGLAMTLVLLFNWSLVRRRTQAQRNLQEESNFRRAIENAMISGIRVLDMHGRTTYANATFARMVGWSQEELAEMGPPYPYWPVSDRAVLLKRFKAEISGNHYPGGLQLKMQRKNGTLFDARIFITPLLNEAKQQTGWLTTINDITEPNRIRQQLAVAQDRVTLVLESLDASISVTPLGSRELLFANHLYRQWFGAESQGHIDLIAQAGSLRAQAPAATGDDSEDSLMGLPTISIKNSNSKHAEVFVESLGKWLEVRSRYLDWVDGRLAQMLIVTDITARKHTEEQAARQAEHAQNVSRLVTMGEMASSVAHELNQPLAAISNYTGGMISRIKAGTITLEQLIAPLEKTVHQAVRAGQVILRIREFVKRSAPKQELCDVQHLASEAIEIASIELRKRKVVLQPQIEANLPKLMVDAILIEQALINLLKNAAEAVDGAGMPPERRHIQLTARAQNAGVLFAIADQGPGIPESQLNHLFDAFYSTKKEGLGIGLNLCRSIVEAHQGKIQVRNLYNHGQLAGCEFSFWLPGATHAPSPAAASKTDVTHDA